jgi:hypothetical protein
MKKTFKDIRFFNLSAQGFLKKDPANLQTKLGYAIQKLSEGDIKKVITEYSNEYQGLYYENVEKVQVNEALTDKATGAILNAPKDADRPYQYSKEGLLAVMKAEKEFQKIVEKFNEDYDAKEFEISPFIVTEVPEDLDEVTIKAFEGFVLEAKSK